MAGHMEDTTSIGCKREGTTNQYVLASAIHGEIVFLFLAVKHVLCLGTPLPKMEVVKYHGMLAASNA